MGFCVGFGKLLKLKDAGVAKLATQQTQNGIFVASARFETLRNRLIPQKKTTSTRSNRLQDFWVIFEAF
jgi:hypothetical protein